MEVRFSRSIFKPSGGSKLVVQRPSFPPSAPSVSTGCLSYCLWLPDPPGEGREPVMPKCKSFVAAHDHWVTAMEGDRTSALFVLVTVLKVTSDVVMQWPWMEITVSRNPSPPKTWHESCSEEIPEIFILLSVTLNGAGKAQQSPQLAVQPSARPAYSRSSTAISFLPLCPGGQPACTQYSGSKQHGWVIPDHV